MNIPLIKGQDGRRIIGVEYEIGGKKGLEIGFGNSGVDILGGITAGIGIMEAYQERDYAIERYKAQVGEETYKGMKENSKNKNELLKELKEAHQRRKDAEAQRRREEAQARAEEQQRFKEQKELEAQKQKDDLARKKENTDEDYNLTPAEKKKWEKYTEKLKKQIPKKLVISGEFNSQEYPWSKEDKHKGTDAVLVNKDGKNVTEGAKLGAIAGGTKVKVGETKDLGNYVEWTLKDGSIVRYGHLKEVTVKDGDSVVAGQIVGIGGRTGKVTTQSDDKRDAAHVHITRHVTQQKKVNGPYVDSQESNSRYISLWEGWEKHLYKFE